MKGFTPLRRLILLTLLIFSSLVSAALFVVTYRSYRAEAVEALGEQLRYAGGSLAGNLEWALADGDALRVRYFIAQQVTRPHQQLVAYVDQEDHVKYATDLSLHDMPLAALPQPPPTELVERVRRRRAGEIFHDMELHLLWAVFPVSQPPSYREVRSERPGLALMVLDTSPIHTIALQQALQQALFMLLPSLLLSLGVWFMARRLLSDRIERLLDYARSLVAGRALPPPVTGRDELGLLAMELDGLMQQLVVSRDFHVLLLDRMPNPIWRCDAGGRRDYFNAAWLSYTGRDRADEQGDGWVIGLAPEEREHYRLCFNAAFVRRVPFVHEYRLRRHDGSLHWMQEYGEPVFDGEGTFLGYLGSCFDRQRERESAERVAVSEARFRGLVERSMVGVYLIQDGSIQYANPRLGELFGYEPAELVGKPVVELVSPQDRALVSERLRQRIEGTIIHLQYAFDAQRRDGSPFPVEVFGSRIMLEGRPAVIGSLLDVSDRRRAEHALQESEAQFRATFEQAAAGVAHMGVDGYWLRCNDCMCGLFGYTEQELLELSMLTITHPDDRARADGFIKGALAGNYTRYAYEKRYLRKDGRVLWANVAATLLRDGAGEPMYFVVVMEDISGRKEAEAKWQELNAELEARIQARTGELAAANKELETFAYSVSHDLKTPLRGIDGYSHILLEDYGDRLDDTGRTYLANIRRGVGTMGQLIDDLLSYSRMERRELRIGAQPLAGMVQEMVAERGPDVEAGVDIRVDVADGVRVRADREGLALVLRNLIDNAIKYARHAQPPRLEIGAVQLPATVQLWVRDNGIGFDMVYHDRIFEIFQRLERAEDFAGTGVGLAMVRRALERMEGRVWAESKPGEGACFWVELPQAD